MFRLPHNKSVSTSDWIGFSMSKQVPTTARNSVLRAGVTVIEVLTSMIVAAIGVAGVLVLIPFAVSQSQLGIEKDTADILARNAYEELRIQGYTTVNADGTLPWFGGSVPTRVDNQGTADESDDEVVVDGTLLGTALFPGTGTASVFTPGVVHIDPHAVAAASVERTDVTPILGDNAGFPALDSEPNPDFLTKYLPNGLKIPVATLQRQAGDLGLAGARSFVPARAFGPGLFLDLAEARRLVQSEDDLIVGSQDFRGVEAEDIAGPQGVFNVSPGGNPLVRQFKGEMTWSALMVPAKNSSVINSVTATRSPTRRYKMYTLVYANRSVREADSAAGDVRTQPDMLAAQVQRHPFAPNESIVPFGARRVSSPNLSNLNGGFTESVNRIVLSVPIANVFKDDWVMLINRRLPRTGAFPFTRSITDAGTPPATYPFAVEEAGFDTQIAFCRVISVNGGVDLNLDGDFLDSESADGVDYNGDGDQSDIEFPSLSVQGGAFDFYFQDLETDPRLFPPIPAAAMYSSDTWVVHLKDVVNVHERTITLD